MTRQVELVAEGIQYPADIVAGEDEQTLYLTNIQSASGAPYSGVHASGQVLRIHMPNAPESVAGATVEVIMSGLANPCFLGRASQTGRMVVQCYGYIGGGYSFPTAREQALLECPSGGVVWPCVPPGTEGGFSQYFGPVTDSIHGPRGVAVSPDGAYVYVFEDELPFINDYLSGNLLAIGPGGREVMWSAGRDQFSSQSYGLFGAPAFLKIDPAGENLWVTGEWDMDAGVSRIPVTARGQNKYYAGQTFGGRWSGVGFQDPLPNLMNPEEVWPFIKAPGFLVEGGELKRCHVPAADGSGFGKFAYRSAHTTGESRYYNLKGLAVTPGGQVFVTCGSFGQGGLGYGNHLSLGSPFSSGCVFRINKLLGLPDDYPDNTPPIYATELSLVQGWNAPQLLDDHSSTKVGPEWG